MKITCLGHSSFLVETKDESILFDPFITPNALASFIDVTSLKPDYILISHGHSDHVHDAEQIARSSGAEIISNYEICNWFEAKGITKTRGMNIGGSIHLRGGKVKLTVAVHSSTMPDGAHGGQPIGFVYSGEKRFYFAGDTGLTRDMELIADQFDLDLAFLPIGDRFTMGPDDALRCAEMIMCNKVIGMHYDTFPSIVIDHSAAIKTFEARGKELILMSPGQTLTI